MKIRRLFVANRGEIAVRILRTAKRLGIETVLGASDIDLDSVPARLADRCVRLGPSAAAKSYLDVAAVVGAARSAGADALHPGYGFLSENSALPRACELAGITFVGPTAATLDAVGDKLAARRHAAGAGLPIVPGGEATSIDEAQAIARGTGWPILIKAVGGGGGRGLRRVDRAADLQSQLELAITEANAAFADSRVYVERFVPQGRHVEVQILGDGQEVVHLGTRDCSVQRRYQKLIEEAPAPLLPNGMASRLMNDAVALGRQLQFKGAGTVEFLVDGVRGEYYFLEVNARIQVEHPVTEMVTGVDLVAEQLAVAAGVRLRDAHAQFAIRGHAIECRINAEDVSREFRPSPGRIVRALFPAGPGIRIDTHVQAGSVIPPFYDSLLAKIVVHAENRAAAVDRMSDALARCKIDGIAVNTALHSQIVSDPEFRRGGVDTGFLGRLALAVAG